jgi:hypothetical protein
MEITLNLGSLTHGGINNLRHSRGRSICLEGDEAINDGMRCLLSRFWRDVELTRYGTLSMESNPNMLRKSLFCFGRDMQFYGQAGIGKILTFIFE